MKKQTIDSSSDKDQMKDATAKKAGRAGILTVMPANDWIEESMKTPDPKMFFHDLIVQYENTVIFAASNVGKSILAVQIAEDIAQKEKVLYVDLELSTKQFQMRYYDPSTGKTHSFSTNFTRAEIEPELMVGADLSQEILDSIEVAAKKGTKFFVIDNITFMCNNTQSSKKAGEFMLNLNRLRKKYGLTCIVVAHTPKRHDWRPITQYDLAGSAKLINSFDAGIAIARSAIDNNLRYLKQVKVRTGEIIYNANNVLILDVNKDNGFLKFDIIGIGNEEDHLNSLEGNNGSEELISILKMSRDGMSVREIAEVLNIGKSTVQRRLDFIKKSDISIPDEKETETPENDKKIV